MQIQPSMWPSVYVEKYTQGKEMAVDKKGYAGRKEKKWQIQEKNEWQYFFLEINKF